MPTQLTFHVSKPLLEDNPIKTNNRKDWQTGKTSEVRLRVRAEMEKQAVVLGLLQDF
jgi:hypothetical protein